MLLSFFPFCLFFLFSCAISIACLSSVSVRILVFMCFRLVCTLGCCLLGRGRISVGDTYPGFLGCSILPLCEGEGSSAEVEVEVMDESSATADCTQGLASQTPWMAQTLHQRKHICCEGKSLWIRIQRRC